MRVLMLDYELPPIGGGGGRAHQSILECLARQPGLEVDVLTSGVRPGVHTESLGESITVTRIGIHKRDLHTWRRLEVLQWLWRATPVCKRLVRSSTYQVVHAFFAFPTGWLCWRDPRTRPYLLSLRGSDVPGTNPRLQLDYALLARAVFRPIWQGAAALVANSEGLRRRAVAFAPDADITVIPNGVDTERFRPASVRPESHRLGLLTVGRLSASKRVHLLIEVVARLRAAGTPVTLTVVGGGARAVSLARLVRDRRLEDCVTLRGRRPHDEMPGIYRSAHVYVSASQQEGMSNAMLEAAASGLPVITTRCEGVDELVADNGVVVDRADAEHLAAAIQQLAADPGRRAAMGGAARSLAERFTWTSVAQRYLDLYDRLA